MRPLSKLWGHSVRVRLTLQSVLTTTTVLAILGATVYIRTRVDLYRRIDRSLAVRARLLSGLSVIESTARGSETALASSPIVRTLPIPLHPRVFDGESRSVTQFATDTPWDESAVVSAFDGKTMVTSGVWKEEPIRVITRPLRHADGTVARVVQFAAPLSDTVQALDSLAQTLMILTPLGLLVAGGIGLFLTSRALRPVRQVTDAATHIGHSDLGERLPVVGGDEFARLSETINAMLARIEASFVRQRQFTGDASHELRTPLTIISANTALALKGERSPEEYRRALTAIAAAGDTMRKLVEDLLLLARADDGRLALDRVPVDLKPLLTSVVGDLNTLEGRASITVDAGDDLIVLGEKTELQRLFSNLLDNAGKHTPAQGEIRLMAQCQGEIIQVSIKDNGSGIASEHLPHLFERFYRADAARAGGRGTGLGLAICKSIVEAHGGTIAVTSVVGDGTTATVQLPRQITP